MNNNIQEIIDYCMCHPTARECEQCILNGGYIVAICSELKDKIIEYIKSQQTEIERLNKLLKKYQKKRKPVKVKGNYVCGDCGNPLHTAIVNPMIQYCDHCRCQVDWSKEGKQE